MVGPAHLPTVRPPLGLTIGGQGGAGGAQQVALRPRQQRRDVVRGEVVCRERVSGEGLASEGVVSEGPREDLG